MRILLTSVAAVALLGVAACGESGNEDTTSVAVTQDGTPTSIEGYSATGTDTGTQVPPTATEAGAASMEATMPAAGTGTLDTSASAEMSGGMSSSPAM